MFRYLDTHEHIPVLRAACWRCQIMVLLLILPAAVELCRLGRAERAKLAMWEPLAAYVGTPGVCGKVPLVAWCVFCGVTWGLGLCTWVVSLRYISTTTASVIVNASPIVMAVYLHFSPTNTSRLSTMEWIGVFIAFSGMGISSIDSGNESRYVTCTRACLCMYVCMCTYVFIF
jgi:drug/metabolite transporter (DMT)-like permease